MLIIRREEEGIRRYCHVGTGNYNDKTAKLYTDFSYMTCDELVGSDVSELFNVLTGYSIQRNYHPSSGRSADHARSFCANDSS